MIMTANKESSCRDSRTISSAGEDAGLRDFGNKV
jgi:hypothetical protein